MWKNKIFRLKYFLCAAMGTNTKQDKFYHNNNGKWSIKNREGEKNKAEPPAMQSWTVSLILRAEGPEWVKRFQIVSEWAEWRTVTPEIPLLWAWGTATFAILFEEPECRTNVILKYYLPPSILLYYTEQLIIVHPRKDPIKVICIMLLFSFPLKTGILLLEVISNDISFRLPVKERVCIRIYTPFLSHQQWESFEND